MNLRSLLVVAAIVPLVGDAVEAKSAKAPVRSTPPDRYFDAAHGPHDSHSLWFAGDYIGRDPDRGIRASMIRER